MVGNGHEPPRRFHGDAGRAYRRGPEVNEDRSRKGMVEAREGFGAHERRRNDGWRQEDVKRARRWPANELSEDKYGRGGSHEMEKQKDGRQEERHVQKFHGRAERNWMNDEAVIDKERKYDDRMDAKHDRRGERVRGFVDSERRPDGSQDGKGVRKFRGEERYAGSERERRHHDEKWVRDDRGTADCEKGRSEKLHGDRHPGKESSVVASERPATDNKRESRGVREPVEERSEARCEKLSREERHVRGHKSEPSSSDLVDNNSKVDRHSESCREDLVKDNDQGHNVGGKPEPQQQGDTGGVDSAEEKGKDNVVGTNEDKVLRDSEVASADIELPTGMDIPVQKMRRDDDETFWGADVDTSFPVSPQVRRQDSPHVSAGGDEGRRSIPRDQAEDDKNCDTSQNQDLDLVHDQDAEIDHDYNQDCHELDHDQDRDWDRGHSQERDPDRMWDRGRGHGRERDQGCDRDDDPGHKKDGDRDLTPDGDLDVDRTGDDGLLWESERLQKEAERISPSPQKEDKRSFSEDDIDWKTDGRDKTESKALSDADHNRNDEGQEEEERPTKGESGRRQMVLVDDEPGRHLQRCKRPREESESPANDRRNQAGHVQAENCQVDGDCDLTVDRGKARYQDLSEKPTGVMSDPVKRDPSEEGVCGRNDRAGPGPGDRSPTSTGDLTLEAERARTTDAPLLSVEGSRECRSRSSTPPTKEYRDGPRASREPRLASDLKDEQEVGGSRRLHGEHDSRDRKVPHEPREGGERGDERDTHNGRDNRDGRSIRDGRDVRYGRDERDGKNGRDERDGRNGRDDRDGRNGRDGRDGRDVREGRDGWDGRDGRGVRDGREMRDVRDPMWSARHTRDMRDTRDAPVRNIRDGRDGKDGWQSRAGSGRDFGGRSGSMGGRRGRRPSLSPPRARRRIRSRSPPHNNQPGGRKRSPWRPKSPVRRSPPPFRRSPGRQLSPQRARVTGVGKPGNNLFVAGFNYITSERDLERKFSRFGRVTNVRIVRDNSRTQESRGFGFVTLERDENADEAIKALDGTNWNGRVVLVEKAKSAPRR
ncbi:hypothetical protein CBR_g55300 [Chara braunii]|uniref:RRM domain-containing protein n=1 Tax=Chara braunii TaxID=69332 RepID=A0A388MD09_CHABU|nr:hypothetical protein CBR_g55300 [Chara braunii]|eukprot:GBG92393.1 hypothetical protein CBR_g55300 [Chara braunii]